MTAFFSLIASDLIAAWLAIATLLANIFFILRYKKIKTRKWFIASIVVGAITIFLLFFAIPFFHMEDRCERSSCDSTVACGAASAYFPCLWAIDVICPLLATASTIIAIFGLVKTQKAHRKIRPYTPYVVSFLISILIAIPIILLVAGIESNITSRLRL